MTLSIVIPALNEESYLPILLESLKNQAFQDFEIIVADADSGDKTRQIAQESGAKVVEGGLPAYGRNRGAKEAKGDWLLFLDADVILPPDFLARSLSEINKFNFDIASPLLSPMSQKMIDKLFHSAYNLYARLTIYFYPHAPGLCIFVKKEIHNLISGFNESIKLAEDHDYIVRACRVGRFGLIKGVRVPVSVRRLDKDGRFNIAVKYLAAETYRFIKGPIYSDLFHYKFGHYDESEKEIKRLRD